MSQAKGVNARFCRVSVIENPNSYGLQPSSMGGVRLPINTIDLVKDRNLITPATITGRRDGVEPAQGYVNVSGNAVVPVDQCAIGYWLQMVFGYPVTTSITSALKQHVFTVSSKLNSFTGEIGYTDIAAYQKVVGLKAGSFSIRIGGDEELTASIGLTGSDDAVSGSSVVTPLTTIDLNRFNNFQATMNEGGAAIGSVRTLELNLNNNLDESIYTIGAGATRRDLPEGLCNVSGRMEAMFENWSYYIHATSGTERNLDVTFTAGSFYLKFDIDELVYKPKSPGIPTPNGLWQDLEFQGYFTSGSGGSIITATLVNTWAAYSGPF